MNYCFFSAQYLPTLGGVERYTYNMAVELIRRGHKVAVITSQIKGEPQTEKDENGIEIYRAKSFPFAGGRLPWLAQDKGLKRFLSAWCPHRIIVQTQLYTLCLFGIKYANKHDIPVAILGHASGHIFSKPSLIKYGTDCYEHILSCLIQRGKCAFYGVSQQSKEWFAHFGINATDTVYNSVPTDLLSRIGDTNYKEKYNISKNTTTVTFVGRLIEEKGIVPLCEAVAALQKKGEDIFLMVIGQGDKWEYLTNNFAENAAFLGGISHQDVLSVLKESQIYCLPSDAEGFPTALLEAAACECYLITTPCGGSNELLSDGKCGEIIKDNQAETIEKALLYALQNKEIVIEKAGNAKEKALTEFSITATCDKLIRLLK